MRKIKSTLILLCLFCLLGTEVILAEETDGGREELQRQEERSGWRSGGIIGSEEETEEGSLQEDEIEAAAEPRENKQLPWFGTEEEAEAYLADEIYLRKGSISFYLKSSLCTYQDADQNIQTDYNFIVQLLLDACLGEGEHSYEGDALYTALSGYKYRASFNSSEDEFYLIRYYPKYRTTNEQELQLEEAVTEAVKSLELASMKPQEQIRAIHDYIDSKVEYAYNNSDELKYTAYGAMFSGKAVCEGYAELFYRMCREAGISARIIFGQGKGGNHAWNIVRLGEFYYNIDTTWDDQKTIEYTYYLKGSEDFPDHEADSWYGTEAFMKQYPLAETFYQEEPGREEGNEDGKEEQEGGAAGESSNGIQAEFTSLEGRQKTSQAQDGKAKVLIFFSTDCGYSQYTFESLKDSGSRYSGADLIAVECSQQPKEQVQAFRDTYGADGITYCYDTGRNNSDIMWQYVAQAADKDPEYYPVIIYIKADNTIGGYSEKALSADQFEEDLLKYTGISKDEEPYTGLVRKGHEYYYETRGKLDKSYNGLAWDDEIGYWMKNGRLDDSCTGLVQDKKIGWCYVEDGRMNSDYTGLVEYSGSWFYTQNSLLDWSYTSLTYYNGTWYYVENGALDWSYTSLTYYNGTWYYVENGVLNWNYTGLAYYNGTWYYAENGVLNWDYTGLTYYNGTWYYVENGVLNWDYTGLTYYNGTWYYVENGVLNRNYTGLSEYNGSCYYIERGMLSWNYTGLVYDAGSWCYIEKGRLNQEYTGLVYHEGSWYYVENGILNWEYTGLVYHVGTWYYTENGWLNWNYTGLTEYYGTLYYAEAGILNWNYSGRIQYDEEWYDVNKGIAVRIDILPEEEAEG